MSQLTIGPPFVIDGPLPVRPRFGLLDVAQILPPSIDPHWQMGATMRAYSSDLPDGHAPCNDGSVADVKSDGGDTLQPTFGPFSVYLPVTCNTISGARPYDEFMQRATVAFEAKEGWAVEQQFAQGIYQPLNPFLGDSNAQVLHAGTAVDPIEALGLLENAIAETAEGGVIHADPATVTAWTASYAVFEDKSGAFLRTALGTPVAVGQGYVGSYVEGHAAPGGTKSWAFATGPVQVRRSEIDKVPEQLYEAMTRDVNEVTFRPERHYLVVWDTALQAAVYIDRSA